jgi:hypothetical protein
VRPLTAKVFYCTCAEFFFFSFFFFPYALFISLLTLTFSFSFFSFTFPDIVRLHRPFVVVSTVVSFLVSSSDVQPFPS